MSCFRRLFSPRQEEVRMSEEALLEELEAVEAILMEGVEKEISEEVKKVRKQEFTNVFYFFCWYFH